MDKSDLQIIFDKILKPSGFKKKGNYWRLEGDELIKIVYLQKSKWSNLYYINYGFDFKALQYNEVRMHIYNGMSTNDEDGNNILDFEKNIPGDRVNKLENLIANSLLKELLSINSIKDIISELKKKPHLNNVPIKVKEFLGINK